MEAEAEAVGSRLFQRKRKQKGSFQIFASLPEAEAVFGLTEITMQITDELRMPSIGVHKGVQYSPNNFF